MLGWFRRHATILMVVLGSAAMVIFGLGSVFNSIASSAREKVYENPTVAEWEDGKLTRDDIKRVYRTHSESVRFLGAVVEAAEAKAGGRITPLASPVRQITANNDEDQMQEVLSRMMMAQAAKKQGFVVDDAVVKEYILLVSGDAGFSDGQLDAINRKVNQTSIEVVRDHLKTELLAMQMASLSAVGMFLPPNPTEAISLYGRTAERIDCEVIPIPVKDFMSEVSATPPEKELQELYQEGRDDLPDPLGIKPGFKADRKINVQYLVAKADTFLLNGMNNITDEEVQKEYDRLKSVNDMMVIEPIVRDNSFAIPGLDDLPGMSDGDSSSNPEGSPTSPNEDAPALPDDDAPAPPSDGGSVQPDAAVPAPSDAPATEAVPGVNSTPEVDVPSVEVPNVETAPEAPENSSHVIRGTRAQFVSIQDLTLSGEQEGAEQAIDQAAEAVEQQAAPALGEDAPATTPQDDSPAEPATDSVELPQADLPQAGGIGSDIDDEVEKQDAAPERKYKPLTDVAETIRRSLALPIANAKMTSAIEEMKHEVDDYFFELESWESDEDDAERGEKPQMPDFEALAKRYKLQLKQTGLVNRNEMKVDPLGSIPLGNGTLSEALFFMAGDRALYESTPFGGASAIVPDYYLFWNIENEQPHVLDFEDAKPQIVEFWKKQQALELAEKEAQSIRTKVNDNRKSKLSELYPERALTTGQFSWFDSVRGGILSQPGNVENPSDEFMETAFSLQQLEAGVAVGRDRETVYVIQSISGNRPVEELGADYLQNQFAKFKQVPREVNRAAGYYYSLEKRKADEALRKELGFELDSEFTN